MYVASTIPAHEIKAVSTTHTPHYCGVLLALSLPWAEKLSMSELNRSFGCRLRRAVYDCAAIKPNPVARQRLTRKKIPFRRKQTFWHLRVLYCVSEQETVIRREIARGKY